MSEILTPQSPRWNSFCSMLENSLLEGMPEDTWDCDNTYRLARSVMAKLGDIDIAATLNFFQLHGGYCDCEILFNVADPGHDDDDEGGGGGGGEPVTSTLAA